MIAMQRDGEWLVGTLTDAEAGLPFGDLLREKWKWPKKTVHLLFQQKAILVNGEPAFQHHKAEAGQTIRTLVCPTEEYGVEPLQAELHVLYEDDHALVVNKPVGLLVHPTEPHHRDTLDHRVAGYFASQSIHSKVRHIHRLDQETSGGVLYAKHPIASALLDERLRAQEIKRAYVAYVHGQVEKEQGTINQPLGKDRHQPNRRRVTPNGETAITHYRVLERYKRASKIECSLETGRTHQIRVHLSHLDHALVGDTLYGGRVINEFKRQALHARELRFLHPFGGQEVSVEADFPADLLALEQYLRHY